MPDLSVEAIDKFWKDRHDPFLRKIIKHIEEVETWTIDGDPELEAKIKVLGEALDTVDKLNITNEEDYINLLGCIKLGRALRIMQYLDMKTPGSASKLLVYAEVSSSAATDLPGLFLNRNLVFERMQLLSRIFSPKRFSLVTKIAEQVTG